MTYTMFLARCHIVYAFVSIAIVGHFPSSSLSNRVVPESRRPIGQKKKNGVGPKTPANVTRPYSTQWVGSGHETINITDTRHFEKMSAHTT